MSLRIKWKEQNEIKGTKTTTFLLPAFGYNRSFYTEFLIDCYLKNLEDKQIVLCFKNVEDIRLSEQIYRICNHHSFDESYTDDNDKELVVILNLDKEFHNDFKRFIEGKYSKFSDKLKDLLMRQNEKKTGNPEHKVTVFDVIYPTKAKAKAIADYYLVDIKNIPEELLDKPNLEVELYKTIKEIKGGIKK